ncbi:MULTISPECIES: glycosyltransferase family 1 protein [Butyricimonas]|uniref:glycosyltransferase family 1 protein n=1 Tax=Butyricimonas TaxID=574697 RepID=UPI001D069C04|nr:MULTISPECIES: glycosyltransferase family 1 protein [Butyricimonas]MCB6972386.1 glycosyltransferase family 1 protein [Butyricimonas synergistica]MCG4519394.1 glycosyltransferase family 1 protein [Butyricimonas sp. DFI.6.44]
MKALFLIFHGFNPSNGISKKIHYQVHALSNNGVETHLCYLEEKSDRKYRMVDDKIIASYGKGLKSKIYKRIEFNSIVNYAMQHQINFVYIRSAHNANPFTIRMIRKMKQAGIRVVMEIPTYPYDQEYVSTKMKLQLRLDQCFRKKMAKLLDKIVTFSNYNTIFGVPTLQISNGIDFNEIPVKQQQNDVSQELHLIGVAEIHFWHGFDRLIKGLANYYSTQPNYKVYFHIIGDFFSQRERHEYVSIIKEYHIEPYVILHGQQHGKSLDALFELCHLGIGSLARHRSGITNIKTLKNREYAARGIPFIYSEIDDDFEDMPYIMKIPANEEPVDITKLLLFYCELNTSPQEIRDSIQFLSWKNQMKKVIENI